MAGAEQYLSSCAIFFRSSAKETFLMANVKQKTLHPCVYISAQKRSKHLPRQTKT
jgi:hypothetical protein